jgi:predicted ATPase
MTLQAKKLGSPEQMVSNPLAFVTDPLEFNRLLLDGRIQQFTESQDRNDAVVFFDRGIPDVLAYMNYFGQAYGMEFTEAARRHRYDAVIVIPPWESIYISDNERLESFQEATEIHTHLEETYQNLGYRHLLIPEGSVAERTGIIEKYINTVF